MSEVAVLTNRKPYFYVKFIEIIFEGLEEDHDVTHVTREDSVLQTTLAFLSTLLRGRPDMVIVVGSGFATFFSVVVGRLLPGTTVLFYHQDFTYQFMRDFKSVPRWRLWVEKLQEGVPLRVADIIGTMTPYHEQYLRQKGIYKPFVRIPQGAYLDEFSPEKGGQIREELDIDEDTLAICVVGSFNYAAKIDVIYGWVLLEALAQLDDDEPVVGVLIGGGEDQDYLEQRIQQLGIEEQTIQTGHIDHEKLSEYLGAMDVSMLVKPDHPADKMTTTMKLPEYLAAGTYLIADDHAHASTLLDADKASLLPYEGYKDEQFPERVATEIRNLVANPDRVSAGKEHSRHVAEAEFDYELLQDRIVEEIDKLI